MDDESPQFLEELADGVLTITFNRPEQGNAMQSDAVVLLTGTLRAAQDNPAVRCLLIKGKGKHFSTGGNVSLFASDLAGERDIMQAKFKTRLDNAGRLVEAIMAFDRPIVAAIRGGVAGAGLLYALAADLVIGDDTAFFLFAHQRMGLNPDAGVSYLLPRVVGTRQASRLVFTAAKVDASEAKTIGLLTEIVSGETLDAEAEKAAKRFAKAPQYAIKTAKKLLQSSLSATLHDQLEAEGIGIVNCVVDADFAEGVHSFIEKRPVKFPSAG